jgi:hypothetical protein
VVRDIRRRTISPPRRNLVTSRSMKSLRTLLAFVLLSAPLACGDEHGDEHEFETYVECFTHHQGEEGLSDIAATTECDAIFEVSHDDNAGCKADHAADVTAGVAQTAIDAHCDAAFPPA